MSDRNQSLAQIDKLVSSQTLHGSESLCKLLRYLAQHALDQPGIPVKEYQIATELFGRQPDFDPQVDSMVRVQAGRLRSKLAEYYANEGSGDGVLVELPKGTYLLHIQPRNAPSAGARAERGHEAPVTSADDTVPRQSFVLAVSALTLLLLGSLIALIFLFGIRKKSEPAAAASIPPSIEAFWGGFQKGAEPPSIIFSNAAFVGRPDLGLRYYDPKRDTKAVIFDHYTGVGEVLAVHALDDVFHVMGRRPRVKRGSLFTLDDAKDSDLIFIGSPAENLTLLDIPGTREFQFRAVPEGPRKGNTEIRNLHPEDGEASEYLATPSGEPLTEDYAVIGLVHGLDPSRSILILAGTTTLGTQAAVEFVSNEDSLKSLLSRLGVTRADQLKPFEALIHVKIARGVPVESELIAIRNSAQ